MIGTSFENEFDFNTSSFDRMQTFDIRSRFIIPYLKYVDSLIRLHKMPNVWSVPSLRSDEKHHWIERIVAIVRPKNKMKPKMFYPLGYCFEI